MPVVRLRDQLKVRICPYVELFIGGLVCKEDLVVFFVQNDNTFFHIVQDFLVSNAYCFRVHEYHADLGHDDVDKEEIEELQEAAKDYFGDQ